MTGRVLWKLSILASEQVEEAIAELLSVRFGQPASTYIDLERGTRTVTVFLENKPDWSRAVRQELRKELDATRGLGSGTSGTASARIKLTKLRPQNWAEAWKRHFKPLEIGARLLIKPSWSARRPRHGQATVVLDPGMSFGTGQHPTTSFCLRELARHRQSSLPQSCLDLGTGSGILAICAATLGYEPIEAIDLDPAVIRIARENARKNKVSRQIQFECRDVTTIPVRSQARCSLICANLISNLLLGQKKRIVSRLQKGGLLVVAGILKNEFSHVQTVYEAEGLRLLRSRTEREWRSGSFVRQCCDRHSRPQPMGG